MDYSKVLLSSDSLVIMAYRCVRFRDTVYRVSVEKVERRHQRIKKNEENKRWMSDYTKHRLTMWNRTSNRLRKMTDDFWCQVGITLFMTVHCVLFSLSLTTLFKLGEDTQHMLGESTRYTGYTIVFVL